MTAKIADRIAEAVDAERERIAALAEKLDVIWLDESVVSAALGYHSQRRSFAWRILHPEEFGD